MIESYFIYRAQGFWHVQLFGAANRTRDFKEFIQRGNVVELAAGAVLGGASGKVVTSSVDDVLMLPIGLVPAAPLHFL